MLSFLSTSRLVFSFSGEHRAVLEGQLCAELDNLKTCTAAELEKMRLQSREMHERDTRQAERQREGGEADM